MIDAFLDFAGQGLTFGVTGPGVAVDPATGRLAISSDALVSGVEVVVTAGTSGGSDREPLPGDGGAGGGRPGHRSRWWRRRSAGAGRWAARVEVDPGQWSGEPAPELALQWRAGGVAIPGATEASFVPTPGRGRRGSRLPGDGDERRAAASRWRRGRCG